MSANEDKTYWKVWQNEELYGPISIDGRPIVLDSYQVGPGHFQIAACTIFDEVKDEEVNKCELYQIKDN